MEIACCKTQCFLRIAPGEDAIKKLKPSKLLAYLSRSLFVGHGMEMAMIPLNEIEAIMCKVLTVYGDPEAQRKTTHLEHLFNALPRMKDQEQVVNSAIDFSLFWQAQFWGEAVTAAISADVIVVSLSGRTDLPVPVQRWMESWPHYERSSHTTLVVAFDAKLENDPKQDTLRSYFQKTAELHGLEFMWGCIEASESASQPLSFQAN